MAWRIDDGDLSIGVATSEDGISWTKYGGNPILVPGRRTGSEWAWEGPDYVGWPTVLLVDGVYHMWYSNLTKIGHATSFDGFHWQTSERPDLEALFPNEACGVTEPSVLLDNDLVRMWYATACVPDAKICYAEASSGVVLVPIPTSTPINYVSRLRLPIVLAEQ